MKQKYVSEATIWVRANIAQVILWNCLHSQVDAVPMLPGEALFTLKKTRKSELASRS